MGRVDTVGSRTHFARPASTLGIRWRRARAMDPIRELCSVCDAGHVDLECRRLAAEKLRRAPHVAPSHPTVCPGDRDGHLRRVQDFSSPDASAEPGQAGTALWRFLADVVALDPHGIFCRLFRIHRGYRDAGGRVAVQSSYHRTGRAHFAWLAGTCGRTEPELRRVGEDLVDKSPGPVVRPRRTGPPAAIQRPRAQSAE